ncbi:bactofilin family protein [Roseospira visakhapatnamensis]|uniref:Cytoskeletal protein CcmA (Bactofilin family) n=1 Tax=Roseospira visakhapatnamensis TaxID=390880 RepID=A0A7W6RFI3_9PROT|nr:polymer-forming cytoskeletal protein [Roseospira visakhapatnamensis]MBB4267405.1 cytoskeletal protein CcmA (bactofilin family) [Roseospira visakhapatnamensis]
MFSRGNTKPTAATPAPVPSSERRSDRRLGDGGGERAVPSIVSADLTVTGDLVSAGEIQIDGRVEGDIKCASLIIGISGAVTGEVSAQTVRMHGSVSGQVIAKSVFLASTARMVGDVTHESLAIEPGAFMEGHCRRMAEVPDLALPETRAAATAAVPRLTATAGDAGADGQAKGGDAKDSSGNETGAAASGIDGRKKTGS